MDYGMSQTSGLPPAIAAIMIATYVTELMQDYPGS